MSSRFHTLTRRRIGNRRALDRAMVEAIREVLGLDPLYSRNSQATDVERFAQPTYPDFFQGGGR